MRDDCRTRRRSSDWTAADFDYVREYSCDTIVETALQSIKPWWTTLRQRRASPWLLPKGFVRAAFGADPDELFLLSAASIKKWSERSRTATRLAILPCLFPRPHSRMLILQDKELICVETGSTELKDVVPSDAGVPKLLGLIVGTFGSFSLEI